jgi:hypothetical protein
VGGQACNARAYESFDHVLGARNILRFVKSDQERIVAESLRDGFGFKNAKGRATQAGTTKNGASALLNGQWAAKYNDTLDALSARVTE